MAAYRRICDSRHLQADRQEPGSVPERSVIEYGLPLPFLVCGIYFKLTVYRGNTGPGMESLIPAVDDYSVCCW